MKVGVVTAFVPLPVKHLSPEQYHELGHKMIGAVQSAGATVRFFNDDKLESLWAYDLCTGLPPNNPVPADRYDSPEINVQSHVVQHNRTTWAMRAAAENPSVDVWVWLDYGILKQGFWKNNPVTPEKIGRFIGRLSGARQFDVVPFPGIADKATVYPTGNNWRFCGSTHIWPKQYLEAIHQCYQTQLQKWVVAHNTVPLDLPIWALVEQHSGLPFKWYTAEYDASQLDNLPENLI